MVIHVPKLKVLNILGFIFWISEKNIFLFFIFFGDENNYHHSLIYLNNILELIIDETKK